MAKLTLAQALSFRETAKAQTPFDPNAAQRLAERFARLAHGASKDEIAQEIFEDGKKFLNQ